MTVCPSCGFRSEEGDRICGACGEALDLIEDHIGEAEADLTGMLNAVEEEAGRAFWHLVFKAEGLVFAAGASAEGKSLYAQGGAAAVFLSDTATGQEEARDFFKMKTEEIIGLDQSNFFLAYDEIERVELRKIELMKGPFFLTGLVTIMTGERTMDLYFPGEALEKVYRMFNNVLPDKTSMP